MESFTTPASQKINFGYFRTPNNGYICIALKRPEKGSSDNVYHAGFSFCSPKEKSFTKKIARHIASGRLNVSGNYYIVANKQADKLREAFAFALIKALDEKKAPRWVFRSLKRNPLIWGLGNKNAKMKISMQDNKFQMTD